MAPTIGAMNKANEGQQIEPVDIASQLRKDTQRKDISSSRKDSKVWKPTNTRDKSLEQSFTMAIKNQDSQE